MDKTGIEWTDSTWNPVSGCTKVSPGCTNCYAEKVAEDQRGSKDYPNGFNLTLRPERLEQPLKWTKPRLIFVNSMSDLFHKDVPLGYIKKVFDVMNQSGRHTFQILTKRPEIMLQLSPALKWTSNIWAGTSIENSAYLKRIDDLRGVSAAVRFLSIEPLLGPIQEMDLAGINWIIVGGESGPNARPMEISWVERIQDICKEQDVPFFFKQWGGTDKYAAGRTINGELISEYPRIMVPPMKMSKIDELELAKALVNPKTEAEKQLLLRSSSKQWELSK